MSEYICLIEVMVFMLPTARFAELWHTSIVTQVCLRWERYVLHIFLQQLLGFDKGRASLIIITKE